MSVRELIVKQQSQLNFIENTGSQRLHFTCGSIKGYVSPAASKHVEQGKIDDFWYAEVSIEGKPHVPCIMLVKKEEITSDDLPF